MDPNTDSQPAADFPMPTLQGEELKAVEAAQKEIAHNTLDDIIDHINQAHDALDGNFQARGLRGELMSILNRLGHAKRSL